MAVGFTSNGSSNQPVIFTTTNGTSWTPVSDLPANIIQGIACPNGGGLLCAAVGKTPIVNQGAIFTTTNGATWTSVSGLPANTALDYIACPNGGDLLCVASDVTASGPVQPLIFTTTNGITWTPVSGLPASTILHGIACPNGGGLLCAVVGNTTLVAQAVIFTTTTGTTWTPVAGLPANTSLTGIACPNGGGLLCVAVGETSSGTQAVILVSSTATPPELISALINQVNSLQLPQGLQTSLDAKLQAALSSVNADNTTAACNQLGAFTNEVQAQSGKQLTTDQANQLVAAATTIRNVLGC